MTKGQRWSSLSFISITKEIRREYPELNKIPLGQKYQRRDQQELQGDAGKGSGYIGCQEGRKGIAFQLAKAQQKELKEAACAPPCQHGADQCRIDTPWLLR